MAKESKPSVVRRILTLVLCVFLVYLVLVFLGLVLYRFVNPPITGVQLQRLVEARLGDKPYEQDARWVPLSQIGSHLQHAVIAAEDGRFYQHSGIDWEEVGKVLSEELPRGRMRGASSLTQQLVKNLFMTTHQFPLRKPLEWVLAPAADKILGKRRQLEIYLNTAEWGPGIFGAEAAARRHYGVSAASLSREQAARLAAVLPNPRRRQPERQDKYAAIILNRMEKRGW